LEYRFYLDELPTIEPSWALMAGEIMFDLRCALDHLVWELHVRHYRGRSIPESVEFTGQFPIYDSFAEFRRKELWRIKTLSEPDRRAICFLQPYIRRNDKWSSVRRALRDLNAMHSIDKHRKLHLVAGTHRFAVAPHFPADCGFRFDPTFGPVKPHDHIDAWTFMKPPPNIEKHEGAYLEIVLEQPGYERNLVMLLSDQIDSVGAILIRFSGRFPALPPAWRSAPDSAV
jgi:hypothetical protein